MLRGGRSLPPEPLEEELPDQRVVCHPRPRALPGPHREADRRELLGEVLRQPERRGAAGIELMRDARVDYGIAEPSGQAIERLLGEELEQALPRRRAAQRRDVGVHRAERGAERPALGDGEEAIRVAVGLARAPDELGALLGREGEVAGPQLGDAAAAPELREPQGERRAGGYGHAEHGRVGGDQVAHKAHRARGVGQRLRVVEGGHDLRGEETVELVHELCRRGPCVHVLGRHREPLRQEIHGARCDLGDHLHEPAQQRSGIAVRRPAAQPHAGSWTEGERLLEGDRLAATGAGR